MSLQQMFSKPPLPPANRSMSQQGQKQPGVMSHTLQQSHSQQGRPQQPQQPQQQQQQQHYIATTGTGLRQQLNMPPSNMSMSPGTANSAIEQLKKHADTMALQEQNAAIKVKELSQRLDTTDKAKKAVEMLLKKEQLKVQDMEAKHLEDTKQYEVTMSKLDLFIKNQISLEKDVQLAKQSISQASENEAFMSSKLLDQDHEVQDLSSKYTELDRARLDLQAELQAAVSRLDETEEALRAAQADGSDRGNEIARLQEQLHIMVKERSCLVEQVNACTSQLDVANTARAALESQLSIQLNSLQVVQGDLDAAITNASSLETALEGKSVQVADMEHQLKQLMTQEQEAQVQVKELQLTCAKHEAELQAAAASLNDKQREVEQLESVVTELQTQIQELTLARDETAVARDGLSQSLEELKAIAASKEAILVAELQEKAAAMETLQTVLQQEHTDHERTQADLQMRLSVAEAAAATASSSMAATRQASSKAAQATITELGTRLSQANGTLSKQAQEFAAKDKEVQNQNAMLRSSIASVTADLLATKESVEASRQEAAKQARGHEELVKGAAKAHALQLKAEALAAEEARKEADRAKAALAKAVEDARTEKVESDRAYSEARLSLERAHAEYHAEAKRAGEASKEAGLLLAAAEKLAAKRGDELALLKAEAAAGMSAAASAKNAQLRELTSAVENAERSRDESFAQIKALEESLALEHDNTETTKQDLERQLAELHSDKQTLTSCVEQFRSQAQAAEAAAAASNEATLKAESRARVAAEMQVQEVARAAAAAAAEHGILAERAEAAERESAYLQAGLLVLKAEAALAATAASEKLALATVSQKLALAAAAEKLALAAAVEEQLRQDADAAAAAARNQAQRMQAMEKRKVLAQQHEEEEEREEAPTRLIQLDVPAATRKRTRDGAAAAINDIRSEFTAGQEDGKAIGSDIEAEEVEEEVITTARGMTAGGIHKEMAKQKRHGAEEASAGMAMKKTDGQKRHKVPADKPAAAALNDEDEGEEDWMRGAAVAAKSWPAKQSSEEPKPGKSAHAQKQAPPVGAPRPAQSAGAPRPAQSAGTQRPAQLPGAQRPGQPTGAQRPAQSAGAQRPAQSDGAARPAQSAGGHRNPAQPAGSHRMAVASKAGVDIQEGKAQGGKLQSQQMDGKTDRARHVTPKSRSTLSDSEEAEDHDLDDAGMDALLHPTTVKRQALCPEGSERLEGLFPMDIMGLADEEEVAPRVPSSQLQRKPAQPAAAPKPSAHVTKPATGKAMPSRSTVSRDSAPAGPATSSRFMRMSQQDAMLPPPRRTQGPKPAQKRVKEVPSKVSLSDTSEREAPVGMGSTKAAAVASTPRRNTASGAGRKTPAEPPPPSPSLSIGNWF